MSEEHPKSPTICVAQGLNARGKNGDMIAYTSQLTVHGSDCSPENTHEHLASDSDSNQILSSAKKSPLRLNSSLYAYFAN